MSPSLLYDELPIWSAPFGLTLLDHVRILPGINVLDIGSGSGFPMLELAERLGKPSMVYGIDPSEDSIAMITAKKEGKGITNAKIIRGYAEEIPFPDDFFQLIISNNGLNNVSDQARTLSECHRVSKYKAQMLLTMNLPETMSIFYQIFEEVLLEQHMNQETVKLKTHIFEKRKPPEYLARLIEDSGFSIVSAEIHSFNLRYTDGTAFLNHYFIRKAFMDPWKSILPDSSVAMIFNRIEEKLNQLAAQKGELSLAVPYVCFDCLKEQTKK